METVTASITCGLLAHASCHVPVEQLAALRKQPGPVQVAIAPNQLRHSDEQTVVSLTAVLTAVHCFDLKVDDFRDWGIIAAPRFPGRTVVAHTVPHYLTEGAWGVSPYIIPHRSLHSVPGAISLALGLHGPNFGISGGPGGEAEALLAAATLLHDGSLPGVWVVASRLSPDGPCNQQTGQAAPGTIASAVALALTPISTSAMCRLCISPTSDMPSSLDELETLVARYQPGHTLRGPHAHLFAKEPR